MNKVYRCISFYSFAKSEGAVRTLESHVLVGHILFSIIETLFKNKRSHMFDIGVCAYLQLLFFRNNEEFA